MLVDEHGTTKPLPWGRTAEARSMFVVRSSSEPLPWLRIDLLGGFRVERGGGCVGDWQRRSAKRLIKLLAISPGHALHREQVLELLWPGVDLPSALNSFGKALHAARRAIEPELLPRRSSTYVRLVDSMLVLDEERVVVDADRFEQLAEKALRGRDVGAYQEALGAYGGELLPEDRYEDWCEGPRSFLAELRVRLLLGSAELLEGSGAYNESANRLREVLQQDRTREAVHRSLMHLYAAMGMPDQAVRQFHVCEEVLRRELDMAPQHQTVALYQDVLANGIPELSRAPGPERTPVISPRPRQLAARNTLDTPFVGHEKVIASLCDQLARANPGEAGMALISGEAGAGKTRLLEELASRARRQGATVLWGGTGAHASQFGCGPFAVALENYAASRSEPERDELARRYPVLARFVPSLGTNCESQTWRADPSCEQLDLVAAVARFLTDLARSEPVLVVLGDLAEADRFSIDLLRYLVHLAARRPWLMVGAVREEEVVAGTELCRLIEATVGEQLCLKVDLDSLSRSDCDTLVAAMLADQAASDEVLRQIHFRSGGNPLFVAELVRQLRENSQAGADRIQSDQPFRPARVPARIRAHLAARLTSMDETARRVIELAASAGAREVSLSELRNGAAELAPSVSDRALFDALDRALQMRLMEERETGYAFRHPIVQSALYENLPHHRRYEFQAALGSGGAQDSERLAIASAG